MSQFFLGFLRVSVDCLGITALHSRCHFLVELILVRVSHQLALDLVYNTVRCTVLLHVGILLLKALQSQHLRIMRRVSSILSLCVAFR